MKIDINCKSANIRPNGYNTISVDIEDCDQDSILDEFTEDEVIKHFSMENILDSIGKDECMEYFDLIENNE